MMFKKAREATFAKTKGNYPAPGYIIDVIETGMNEGMKAGLKPKLKPCACNDAGVFSVTSDFLLRQK